MNATQLRVHTCIYKAGQKRLIHSNCEKQPSLPDVCLPTRSRTRHPYVYSCRKLAPAVPAHTSGTLRVPVASPAELGHASELQSIQCDLNF